MEYQWRKVMDGNDEKRDEGGRQRKKKKPERMINPINNVNYTECILNKLTKGRPNRTKPKVSI